MAFGRIPRFSPSFSPSEAWICTKHLLGFGAPDSLVAEFEAKEQATTVQLADIDAAFGALKRKGTARAKGLQMAARSSIWVVPLAAASSMVAKWVCKSLIGANLNTPGELA